MAEENQNQNQPINLSKETEELPAPDESTPLPRSHELLFGTSTTPPKKTNWPELVGLTAEEAEMKIKEEMPMAEVQVIPQDHFVTMDFRTNRVRIFVDSSSIVVRAPMIG